MALRLALLASVSLALSATAAQAGQVITNGAPTVANPTGGAGTTVAYDATFERGASSGYTEVTSNAPRGADGVAGSNGSLEIHGDRSRYVIGSIYENGTYYADGTTLAYAPSTPLALLSQIEQLTFDWQTAVVGSGQAHAAPVVRLHIMDNNIRSEMIWEYVYNGGTAGVAPPSGWQVSGDDSLFYLNVRDNDGVAFLTQNAGTPGLTINGGTQGEVYLNGGLYKQTISDWQSLFSDNAFITGFSFGAGSGFGSNYVGFIDNVAITGANGTYVNNFEIAQAAAVPEPASWAMMISGFGLVGGAMRRRGARLVAA